MKALPYHISDVPYFVNAALEPTETWAGIGRNGNEDDIILSVANSPLAALRDAQREAIKMRNLMAFDRIAVCPIAR